MIAFLLIGFVAILIVGWVLLAYSSNNRKRAGQSDATAASTSSPVERRSEHPDF